MSNDREWTDRKLAQQRQLYEKYGKALEKEHKGEFVAISLDGQTLLGEREGELFSRALDAFGRDNFAIARVGHKAMHNWVSLR